MVSLNTIINRDVKLIVKRYPIINWLEIHRALLELATRKSSWAPIGQTFFPGYEDWREQTFHFKLHSAALLRLVMLFGTDSPRADITLDSMQDDYFGLLRIVVNEIFNKGKHTFDTTTPYDVMPILMPSFITSNLFQLNPIEVGRTGHFFKSILSENAADFNLDVSFIESYFRILNVVISVLRKPRSFPLDVLNSLPGLEASDDVESFCITHTQWLNLFAEINKDRQLDDLHYLAEPFHQNPFFISQDKRVILSSFENFSAYYNQGLYFFFETKFKGVMKPNALGGAFEKKCRKILQAHLSEISEQIKEYDEDSSESFQITHSQQLPKPDVILVGPTGGAIAFEFTTAFFYRKVKFPKSQSEYEEGLKEKLLSKMKQVYTHIINLENNAYQPEYADRVRGYIPIFVTIGQEITIDHKDFINDATIRLLDREGGNEVIIEEIKRNKYFVFSVSQMDLLMILFKLLGWEDVYQLLLETHQAYEDSYSFFSKARKLLKKQQSIDLYEVCSEYTNLY